jgi:hypothetical protein
MITRWIAVSLAGVLVTYQQLLARFGLTGMRRPQ